MAQSRYYADTFSAALHTGFRVVDEEKEGYEDAVYSRDNSRKKIMRKTIWFSLTESKLKYSIYMFGGIEG